MKTEIIAQYKFFNKVNRIFPDNQDEYFVDILGRVCMLKETYSEDGPQYCGAWMDYQENMTAVPFTGFYDKNKNPIYDKDLLSIFFKKEPHFDSDYEEYFSKVWVHHGKSGLWWVTCGVSWSQWLKHNNCRAEIIGSALTNPELLEKII